MRLNTAPVRALACLLTSMPLLAASPGVGADVAATLPIDGTEWQWTQLTQAGRGLDLRVETPELYTLSLLPDGTYLARADCDWGAGGYVLDGAHLALTPEPTTTAECGPASLSYRYLALLSRVAAASVDDGKLVLHLAGASGQMVFVAPQPPSEPAAGHRPAPADGHW